jgi:hypothetical protein
MELNRKQNSIIEVERDSKQQYAKLEIVVYCVKTKQGRHRRCRRSNLDAHSQR